MLLKVLYGKNGYKGLLYYFIAFSVRGLCLCVKFLVPSLNTCNKTFNRLSCIMSTLALEVGRSGGKVGDWPWRLRKVVPFSYPWLPLAVSLGTDLGSMLVGHCLTLPNRKVITISYSKAK